MSLMDRFTVLAESEKSNGCSRLLLEKAFAGSSMEEFDNGSNISDVVVWDEGQQSAILFLDKDWNVSGFSWTDEEQDPDFNWMDSPELASFFASCISWARKNGVSLEEAGCMDGHLDAEKLDEPVEASMKNLLQELRVVLEDNNCLMEDIAYVKMLDRNGSPVCIAPEIFMEMASSVEYMDGRFYASIQSDMEIVLKDGSFIGRMWADGSEWFRFYRAPERNPDIRNLGRDDLCFFNSDMDKKD